jgi:hypothetical protein
MERVDLLISWDTWWRIVAAIVVGCGIYDLILWSFETVAAVRDAWARFPEYRSRFTGYRRRAWGWLLDAREKAWSRILDKDVEEYAARIEVATPPVRTPVASWCLNEITRTLHLAECRFSGSCSPWHWASTFEEARYWAREQGLKVGCSCKPVGEVSAVSG